MKLQHPTLTLTFGNDLETGHSLIQQITSDWIIKDSIIIEQNLLNGLYSSSDTVRINLLRGCPSIEDILATEKDITAVLTDGTTVLFTGFLSTNYTYGINSWGEKNLQVILESVGTRKLSREFITTGYYLFSSTVGSAVRTICNEAGIEIDSSVVFPMIWVHHEVSAGESCRDILDQLFYEIGYAYYFTTDGKMSIFKIDVASLDGAVLVESSDLVSSTQDAIVIQKKARQYKGASITYDAINQKDNVTIYSVSSLELEGGAYFDGNTIHPTDDYEAPYISAVNAASDTDIGSGEIVSFSSPTLHVETTSTTLEQSIIESAGRYFRLYAHNTWGIKQKYSKLSITANVKYVASKEVIRTSAEGSVKQEELDWIHDKTVATSHANLVAQYNQYCGMQYTFGAIKDIPCGTICHIVESLSSLDVYVLVTGRVCQDGSSVTKYRGVGVSVFNLTEETTSASTVEGKPPVGITEEEVEEIIEEKIPTEQLKWRYLGPYSTAAPEGAENTCWLCTADFGDYQKNYPYYWDGVRWQKWTSITRENSSMIMLMLADADGSTADGVINWFKIIVAQSAIINEVFSREITLIGSDSVIRSQVNDEESGFSITGGGQANFKGAVISGNSSFNGVFNCGVIKTEVLPSSSNTYVAPKQENQAVLVCSALSNYGYVSDEYIRCLVDIIPSAYYLKFAAENNIVRFFDQNYSQISLSVYGLVSSRGWIIDASDPAITYKDSKTKSYINAFTLQVYKGGNRLSVDIPSGSAGLLPGMLYEDGGTVKVVK